MRSDIDDRITTVRFNHNPEVLQPMVAVSDSTAPTKAAIAGNLNASSLAPDGYTSIAGGAMVALSELEMPRPSAPATLRKAVVLLTDGIDNTAYQDPTTGQWYSVMGGRSRDPSGGSGPSWLSLDRVDTDPMPWPSGVKGYAVGIGADEDIDRGQLAALSTGTGGFYQVVTCLDGPEYFQLEKYFLQIFMDAVDIASISDPVFIINPAEVHRFEFNLLRGDVGGLVTVFDRDGVRLPVRILSPTGEELTPLSAPAGFQTRNGASPTARFLQFKVPQSEPARYAGRWVVEISHPGIGVLDKPTHQPTQDKAPAMYGIAIGAGSNFRMQPYVTAGLVRIGESVLLTAVLTEAGWPVLDGEVTVDAVAPSGDVTTMILHDDGLHRDGNADDGEYAIVYDRIAEGGSYAFTFRAEGRTRDDEPARREATLAKYVEGRVSLEPTPNLRDIGSCCELVNRWFIAMAALIIVLALLVILACRYGWLVAGHQLKGRAKKS
jgi:hypothetical protein